MAYLAAEQRYDQMECRRCGRGGHRAPGSSRSACGRTSATPGPRTRSGPCSPGPSTSGSPISTWPTITGRRPGPRRINAGKVLQRGPAPAPRRAGHLHQGRATTCGPAPRRGGGSRKYMLGSLDAELPTPRGSSTWTSSTPTASIPETPAGGDNGRARHRGATGGAATSGSRPRPPRAHRATRRRSCRNSGTPLLIHQPAYSMLNRWPSTGWCRHSATWAWAASSSPPLAPGVPHRPLSRRRAGGLPGQSSRGPSTLALSEETLAKVRALRRSRPRGQTIAQMALAWTLRDPRVTIDPGRGERRGPAGTERRPPSTTLDFSPDELEEIDRIVPRHPDPNGTAARRTRYVTRRSTSDDFQGDVPGCRKPVEAVARKPHVGVHVQLRRRTCAALLGAALALSACSNGAFQPPQPADPLRARNQVGPRRAGHQGGCDRHPDRGRCRRLRDLHPRDAGLLQHGGQAGRHQRPEARPGLQPRRRRGPGTFSQLCPHPHRTGRCLRRLHLHFWFTPNLFAETKIPTYGYNVSGNWAGPDNLFAAGGSIQDYHRAGRSGRLPDEAGPRLIGRPHQLGQGIPGSYPRLHHGRRRSEPTRGIR